MSEPTIHDLPMCACEQFYATHHPECPVRRRIAELEAALAKVKAQADYINNQADAAQVRLLKHGTDREVPLYDDTYWQGVADRVRFELYRALEQSK